MSDKVLDSYALLAYFRGETEGTAVRGLLEKAGTTDRHLHMTEVNYAEVKYIVTRKDGAAAWEQTARIMEALPIEFHPADRRLADLAADFKARFALSLADCFAAALAFHRHAVLVTGDPEFKAVEKEIKIQWLDAGRG